MGARGHVCLLRSGWPPGQNHMGVARKGGVERDGSREQKKAPADADEQGWLEKPPPRRANVEASTGLEAEGISEIRS